MALHNRRYYRIQRQRHINRKKRIIKMLNNYWHYTDEGVLSKGKIHCGCGMCRRKTNNKGKHRKIHGNYAPSKNWKHSDQQKIDSANAAIADYEREKFGLNLPVCHYPPDAFVDYESCTGETLDELIASLPD